MARRARMARVGFAAMLFAAASAASGCSVPNVLTEPANSVTAERSAPGTYCDTEHAEYAREDVDAMAILADDQGKPAVVATVVAQFCADGLKGYISVKARDGYSGKGGFAITGTTATGGPVESTIDYVRAVTSKAPQELIVHTGHYNPNVVGTGLVELLVTPEGTAGKSAPAKIDNPKKDGNLGAPGHYVRMGPFSAAEMEKFARDANTSEARWNIAR